MTVHVSIAIYTIFNFSYFLKISILFIRVKLFWNNTHDHAPCATIEMYDFI